MRLIKDKYTKKMNLTHKLNLQKWIGRCEKEINKRSNEIMSDIAMQIKRIETKGQEGYWGLTQSSGIYIDF